MLKVVTLAHIICEGRTAILHLTKPENRPFFKSCTCQHTVISVSNRKTTCFNSRATEYAPLSLCQTQYAEDSYLKVDQDLSPWCTAKLRMPVFLQRTADLFCSGSSPFYDTESRDYDVSCTGQCSGI